MDANEGPKKKRFCATRLVEAENPGRAETLARDMISTDPRLQNAVLNEVTDRPIIYHEGVSEVAVMAYYAQNRAHSFFWQDEENKE